MKRWTTLSIKSHTKREIERIAVEHGMNQCEAVDMLVEEYQPDRGTTERRENWRARPGSADKKPREEPTDELNFKL